ncbi:MAG: glycoside hydrolase family 172 protein [bacterium]
MRNLLNRTVLACLLAIGAGCGKQDRVPANARPWRAFVEDLTNVALLASLEGPGAKMITSWDRAGGNDDFNNFAGAGTESGWVLLADLKGPGCVRRFWTTGEDFGHPFRLYFDGERKPRFDGTIDQLFGGVEPFKTPLARYFNYCWHSYVPLTYNKSLRIEAKAPNTHPFWGPRRLFFQINYDTYAPGRAVETFPLARTEADRETLARVGKAWNASVGPPVVTIGTNDDMVIAPGATQVVYEAAGPGTLSTFDLQVEPQTPSEWSQIDREFMLQDVVLKVSYNDLPSCSIDSPLGDFFGNPWRKRIYGSMLMGVASNAFHCAMPMPYQKSIRISLVNGSDKPVVARARTKTDAYPAGSVGYLHAEWRRTGPQNGVPHLIADFKGSGKFVGCFLGVTGQENSWWILEGDEYALIDGEKKPSWHGTGLEDYFNGGWYYRGPVFAPLHGIFDRSPFRVAQYRHQLVDPMKFNSSFRLEIERGDQNVSIGHFQSIAYAYLAQPSQVAECPADRATRRAVEDRYAQQTFMLQLFELERINNFQQAIDLIAEYIERHPDAEENGVYRLRRLEYRRLLGETVTPEAMQPFIDGRHGDAAAKQAKVLQWFYAEPNRALVGLNANGGGRLFIDGKEVVSGDHPFNLFVNGVELGDGPHMMAAEVQYTRQDAWLVASIRTHDGLVATGPNTEATRLAKADWASNSSASESWVPVTMQQIPRGVPDAPFIGGVPNAFVLMQSKAYPVSAQDWGYHRDTGYFRVKFEAPIKGWPSFAPIMTGLDR